MKIPDLLKRYPIQFLVWNVNEDTDIFWSDVSTLEDNGFLDPWGQSINIKSAKKEYNRYGEVVKYTILSECQGYPVELVVMNE